VLPKITYAFEYNKTSTNFFYTEICDYFYLRVLLRGGGEANSAGSECRHLGQNSNWFLSFFILLTVMSFPLHILVLL
jgi:hypothetical protein